MYNNINLQTLNYKDFTKGFKVYGSLKEASKKGFEAHHITPVAIQRKEREDLALDDRCYRLTSFEHVVVHYLLAKERGGDYVRIFAAMLNLNEFKLSPSEVIKISQLEEIARLREEGFKKAGEKMKGRPGTFLGKKHTSETRKKMKDNHACVKGENNPRYGVTLSEETKNKIGDANRGRKLKPLTAEHRNKISKALKGTRTGKNNPNYGNKMTEESKKRISEVHKGKVVTEKTRAKLRKANEGKTLSEETKKKIGEAHIGRKNTEETKRRMSQAAKERWARERQKQNHK